MPPRQARTQPPTGGPVYDKAHERLRAQWKPTVQAGQVVCWRCSHLIHPGQRWHLGHNDWDLTKYMGPEHEHCSTSAGATKGNLARAPRVEAEPNSEDFG